MPIDIKLLTNAAYLSEPEEKSRATGWKPARFGPDARNGGLNIENLRIYSDDTVLARFAQLHDDNGNEKHPASLLCSGWWLTKDMFSWLLTRVFGATGQASQNIQSQMLLPPEWNAADCVVRAFPKKDIVLGAWFGRPRSVLIAPKGSKRVIQGGGGEQTEAWMYQLYIPGLANRPHNARNWLQFEGIYSTKLGPGPTLSEYPRIRRGARHM